MKIKCLDYSAEDPKIDLNIEEYLLEDVKSNPNNIWLRFWRGTDSVILGKSQDIEEVCNIKQCIKDKIGVYRRFSGGGAVFHDLGNLNIAIALDRKKWNLPLDPKKSFEWLSLIIQRFLKENGLKSSTGRISDILASNGEAFKKVSGTAQARRGSALLWHSTLMIRTPIERIVKYLPIPPDRPGIKHEDYVTNLKNLNVEKSFKEVKSEITNISKDFFQLDSHCVDFESSVMENLPKAECFNLLKDF